MKKRKSYQNSNDGFLKISESKQSNSCLNSTINTKKYHKSNILSNLKSSSHSRLDIKKKLLIDCKRSNSHLNSVIKFLGLESKNSNSAIGSLFKRIIPLEKTSQGHIEVILSMVLFIGFLIFIFLFLNPSFRTKQELPIKDIQDKVIERISSDIGKLSVIVNTEDDCYSLMAFSKDVNDKYDNNFIEINDSQDPRRYTIYYGNFFDPSLIGVISCSDKIGKDFSLGGYTEESIIVYEKIKELKKDYEENYGGLKESLKVDDFSFKVKDLDGNFVAELIVDKKIPENTNVASKDTPIRVMDNRGNIKEFILNIKTWR